MRAREGKKGVTLKGGREDEYYKNMNNKISGEEETQAWTDAGMQEECGSPRARPRQNSNQVVSFSVPVLRGAA